MTKTFQTGKTYSTRSIGDHNCIISVTIAKRTAKTVTATNGKTFRINVYDNNEQIWPWGKYSMSPIIDATDRIDSEDAAESYDYLEDFNNVASRHHY